MSELEGYDDLVERLRKIATPEQLLKGMTPEERRAGLSPDETVLLLDDEVLRRLPEALIDGLPEHVRAEVRRRMGSDHR